jgi:transglutaminase/protease-like cytokinesis protein 3
MGKRIISLIVASLMLTAWAVPFTNRINLHGGEFSTKSMSLWQLEKYKYTELLRKTPLCYAPYKAYTLVDSHVHIENKQNKNWLVIDTDLIAETKDDADYNRKHAIKYKGNAKERVRQIYRYCQKTTYVAHVKTARDVLEYRQGDCAGIASAFYVMCKKNHIPVRYVIGWTKDGCHAWNRVKIKGHWYWIDPTQGYWFSIKQYKGRTVMEMW